MTRLIKALAIALAAALVVALAPATTAQAADRTVQVKSKRNGDGVGHYRGFINWGTRDVPTVVSGRLYDKCPRDANRINLLVFGGQPGGIVPGRNIVNARGCGKRPVKFRVELPGAYSVRLQVCERHGPDGGFTDCRRLTINNPNFFG